MYALRCGHPRQTPPIPSAVQLNTTSCGPPTASPRRSSRMSILTHVSNRQQRPVLTAADIRPSRHPDPLVMLDKDAIRQAVPRLLGIHDGDIVPVEDLIRVVSR